MNPGGETLNDDAKNSANAVSNVTIGTAVTLQTDTGSSTDGQGVDIVDVSTGQTVQSAFETVIVTAPSCAEYCGGVGPTQIANYPSGFGPNYRGPTFGSRPKWGRANPYFSSGRINTRKAGGPDAAFSDFHALVELNGGGPSIGALPWLDLQSNEVPGYSTYENPLTGQWVTVNLTTGISIRFGKGGDTRLDIPSGSLIGPGVRYTGGVPESVHY